MELQRANAGATGAAAIFLPGIIMPAGLRYAPLLRELPSSVAAYTKELEIYEGNDPQPDYSIETEVEGLARASEAVGIERFFLYGHSAGGAVALAFAAAYPERLLGLAVDEPASDFSPETRAAWNKLLEPLLELPAEARLGAFMQAQVAPGVALPPPAPGPPPDWMVSRPAGIEAFIAALDRYVLVRPLSVFGGPVYYTFGSETNPIWREMRARLAFVFADFTSEEFEGLHHLNTSHAARPAAVVAALQHRWRL